MVWRTKVSLSTRRPVGESEFLALLGLAVSVRADGSGFEPYTGMHEGLSVGRVCGVKREK